VTWEIGKGPRTISLAIRVSGCRSVTFGKQLITPTHVVEGWHTEQMLGLWLRRTNLT